MTIYDRLDHLFLIQSPLQIDEEKISLEIKNLPKDQKEKIQSLWAHFLTNRTNLQKFKELKEAIYSLNSIRKFPVELIHLISQFAGNPSAAYVNKEFQSEMKRCDEENLKAYLADPRIAPYIPNTNENATTKIRKASEKIRALAAPILHELPAKIKKLSPLDLRSWIEALENRDLIKVFRKISETIPEAPLPNRGDPTAIKVWMNDPANQPFLHSITRLNLTSLYLTTLPSVIGKLIHLRELGLAFNKLTTLPTEIWQLVALQELDLSINLLTTLPVAIGQLTALQKLGLAFNKLTTLPSEIGQLVALQALSLSDNKFTTLPAEIWQLAGLRDLRL